MPMWTTLTWVALEDGNRRNIGVGEVTTKQAQWCLLAWRGIMHGGLVVDIHPYWPQSWSLCNMQVRETTNEASTV